MDKSRGDKKMIKDRKDEFNEILSLWNGKEDQSLHFSDILSELSKKNEAGKTPRWYPKKVNRRLDEMVEQHLLDKKKNGTRGADAQYKPAFDAQEFNANLFFEGIRESCKQKGLINKENESLILYGLPKKETLTPIEKKILQHIIGQIEASFENLFLLKKSIKARENSRQPFEPQLIENYVRERIANIFGNIITTEAELKAAEEARKGRFHGLGEMITEVAKKVNISLGDTEELISQEQKLMDYNTHRLESQIYIPKGPDTDLAIIKTLPSFRLEEYELNPYSQLLKLIESWEPADYDKYQGCYNARNPRRFDDADIFYIARSFVRHMSPICHSDSSLTLEQIERLAEWGKLTLKLGSAKNHEKLIRCIYLFWTEHYERIKADKEAEEAWLKLSPVEKQKFLGPHELTIKIDEVDITKIERITLEISAAVKTRMPAKLERKFVKKT